MAEEDIAKVMGDISDSDMESDNNKSVSGKKKKKVKFYETWTFLIIICIALPLVFRALFFSPFHIPSGSMKPTLLVGDYIFASKSAYGYSRYSFPFGYAINYMEGRTGDSKPERGDVIIFRPPTMASVDFIKRLVGMPGDKIQMKRGRLYINGEIVPQEQVEDFIEEDENGSVRRVKRYIETLPNGVSYHVLDEKLNHKWDDTMVYIVPEGNYFLMGDNRDNSQDSRTPTVRYVPEINLVGKAEKIVFSTPSMFLKIWEWFGNMKGDRFWKSIQLDDSE